jgi:hypothetical protein
MFQFSNSNGRHKHHIFKDEIFKGLEKIANEKHWEIARGGRFKNEI